MAKTYWSSKQAAEYLGINLNNLRQVTHRHRVAHEEMGCKGACLHVVPSYGGGMNMTWYDSESIKNYALVRRTVTNPNSMKERKERKARHEDDNPRRKAKKGRK